MENKIKFTHKQRGGVPDYTCPEWCSLVACCEHKSKYFGSKKGKELLN
jgi:hypothetical protein